MASLVAFVVLVYSLNGVLAAMDDMLQLEKYTRDAVMSSNIISLRRRKRQLMSNGETCMLRCMQHMTGMMSTWSDSPSGMFDSNLFSQGHLDEFCIIYRNGKTCMNTCEPTTMQGMLIKAFSSLEYLCIEKYDELLAYLPCFQKSQPAVKEECDTKCGDVSSLKHLQQRQQAAQLVRNINRMSQTMGDVCGILNCQIACQSPIIMRICQNKSAADFMYEFSRRSMSSMEKMFQEVGATNFWPEKCTNFSSQTQAAVPYMATNSAKTPIITATVKSELVSQVTKITSQPHLIAVDFENVSPEMTRVSSTEILTEGPGKAHKTNRKSKVAAVTERAERTTDSGHCRISYSLCILFLLQLFLIKLM